MTDLIEYSRTQGYHLPHHHEFTSTMDSGS